MRIRPLVTAGAIGLFAAPHAAHAGADPAPTPSVPVPSTSQAPVPPGPPPSEPVAPDPTAVDPIPFVPDDPIPPPVAPVAQDPAPEPSPPLPEPRGTRGPSWQVDASLRGGVYSIQYFASPSRGGKELTGIAVLHRFFSPLREDAAPLSLLPFLQRVSQGYLGVAAGGFAAESSGGGPRSSSSVALVSGIDVYLVDSFAITGSFAYGFSSFQGAFDSQQTHTLGVSAGLAVRFDDTRLDLSYAFSAVNADGTFGKSRWGNVTLELFTVSSRRYTFGPWGRLGTHGGEGGVALGFYATQRLGLFVGGFAGKGYFYADDVDVVRYGGDMSASYWVAPAVRLSAGYALSGDEVDAYGSKELEHQLTLSAALRLL